MVSKKLWPALGLTLLPYFLTGCFSGIDVDGLNVPTGAITSYSAKTADQFSLFSHALVQTENIDQPGGGSALGNATAKLDKVVTELNTHATAMGLSQAAIDGLKGLVTDISKGEKASTEAEHIEITNKLHQELMPVSHYQTLITELSRKSGAEAQKLADDLKLALRARQLIELRHLGPAFLNKIGEDFTEFLAKLAGFTETACDNSKFKEARVRLTKIVESVSHLKDISDVDFAGMNALLRLLNDLDAVLGTVIAPVAAEICNLAEFNRDNPQVQDFKNTTLKAHIAKITQWTSNHSLLAPSPALLAEPKPHALGKNATVPNKNLASQLSERRDTGTDGAIFAMANEKNVEHLAEYFALKNEDVLVLDVHAVAQQARILAFNSDKFIDWVAALLKKEAAGRKKPVVILRNVSSLNFDTSVAESSQEEAAAKNLDRLVENASGVFLVVGVGARENYLLTKSAVAKKSGLANTGLNLLQAQAIITKALEIKGETSTEPLIKGAQVLRAFKGADFSVADLDDLAQDYWKQMASANSGNAVQIAVTIAEKRVGATSALTNNVVSLAPQAVEIQLSQNSGHFNQIDTRQALTDISEMGRKIADELRAEKFSPVKSLIDTLQDLATASGIPVDTWVRNLRPIMDGVVAGAGGIGNVQNWLTNLRPLMDGVIAGAGGMGNVQNWLTNLQTNINDDVDAVRKDASDELKKAVKKTEKARKKIRKKITKTRRDFKRADKLNKNILAHELGNLMHDAAEEIETNRKAIEQILLATRPGRSLLTTVPIFPGGVGLPKRGTPAGDALTALLGKIAAVAAGIP
jgi:hypothetical protein